MKIACRCSECGNIFMQDDDDLCLEIDFKEQKISFICRNKSCKHDNIIDLSNWKEGQKKSPLPRMRIMSV